MSKAFRKIRLDDAQRDILHILRAKDDWISGPSLQRIARAFPIGGDLRSLRRRGLIEHDGERDQTLRCWRITDAGRKALS
jgi:hypothetical protein